MPPGTSKWNKIEHRLFSHLSQNWRGHPLIDHETVVSLIAREKGYSPRTFIGHDQILEQNGMWTHAGYAPGGLLSVDE